MYGSDERTINTIQYNKYQKQILKAIQQCKLLINKKSHKYLTNIQPKAPKLNAYVKTHKESMPIRPVVNNTQAPSHRIAKFINTKLQNLELLPNTYNIKKLHRNSGRNLEITHKSEYEANHVGYKGLVY